VKSATFAEPPDRDRLGRLICCTESAALLGGMGEQDLVIGLLAEDVYGSLDVPSARDEGLDERPRDVLVGEEPEAAGHYRLAFSFRYSVRRASCPSSHFRSCSRCASISSLWS
jgi:hypothetical protein